MLIAYTSAGLGAMAGILLGDLSRAKQLIAAFVVGFGTAVVGTMKETYYYKWWATHNKCPKAMKERRAGAITNNGAKKTDYCYSVYYSSKP